MSSFDIVGSIAVLEVQGKMGSKKIANQILSSHPNIKTVVKKSGGHEGKYRLQKFVHVAGEKTKETIHRENAVSIYLDIDRTYFSPRMATERLRVASQVKPGENVLVMFSGCGPFPLVIAKNSKARKIVGVEANLKAHKMGLKNVQLNKIKNVELFSGDVRKVLPSLRGKFDRILMPLPKGAYKYLDVALSKLKKGGIIHLYDFLPEEEIPQGSIKKLDALGKKYKVLGALKCGQLAPRKYRVCIDAKF